MYRTRPAAALSLFLSLGLPACSSSEGDTTPTTDTGADTMPVDGATDGGGDTATEVTLSNACKDAIDAVYGDPGALPADKGAIIKCARDVDLSKDALKAALDAIGYKGKAPISGAHQFRILYRTERAGTPAKAGYSSGILLLPDAPLANAPLMVVGRGSRGQAAKCAVSRQDLPNGKNVNPDYQALVYPLVGAGHPVVVSDLAGYSNFGAKDNPPSVYGSAEDGGKSVLDSARAARKLAPKYISDKTVLVGHSQGGHLALSALAISSTYATDIPLSGVVTFSPLWLSAKAYATLWTLAENYKIAEAPAPNAVSIWYHYSQAELFDGPGKGQELFKPEKRAAIKKFFDETCWEDKYPALESLGRICLDLFDDVLTDAIKESAAFATDCPAEEPGKSLCKKWLSRYAADRPHITGAAAAVPQLVLYGQLDTTIPPDWAACILNRLQVDTKNIELCVDPTGPHGVTRTLGDYALQWVANRTMGAPKPAACAVTKLLDAAGAPVKCFPLLPVD